MLNFVLIGKKSFLASGFAVFLKSKKIKFIRTDIVKLKKKLLLTKFSHVVLFTHRINLKKKITDTANDIKNLEIIKNRVNKKTKLVYLSTTAVIAKYNFTKKNSYYYSKKICENYIKVNFSNYLIIRFPNIYGKKQRKNFLIPRLINKFQSNEKIILNNYMDTRDCIYVSDAIKIIFRFINKGSKKIINVGSGNVYTIQKICEIIKKICNSKKKIFTIKKNSEIPKGHLLKKNIRFNFINLERGLKKIINKSDFN